MSIFITFSFPPFSFSLLFSTRVGEIYFHSEEIKIKLVENISSCFGNSGI